jgi:hypothetical protein
MVSADGRARAVPMRKAVMTSACRTLCNTRPACPVIASRLGRLDLARRSRYYNQGRKSRSLNTLQGAFAWTSSRSTVVARR